MIIRPLASHDIASCVELVRLNFSEERATEARQEISTAYHVPALEQFHYVAFKGGSLVGFAGMMRSRKTPGAYDFTWLAVRPDHQGSGIGSALVRHRIAEAEKHGATAIELTTIRPNWFKRFGFKVAARYKGNGLVGMFKQLRDVNL